MIPRIETRIARAIEERVFPGCAVGVVDRSDMHLVFPFGGYTYEPDSPRVREDTIYDVASITKSIPVSCLALRLIEEGRLHLDDRLIEHVPEFNNPDREAVLVRHLLTHTLHFGFPLSSLKNEPPDRIMGAIFDTLFRSRPGAFFSYANATSILLGLVIERLYGKPLDAVAQEEFFDSLEMKRTTFHPLLTFEREEIAPTEIDGWRGGVVQGEVHDETAWVLLHRRRGSGRKDEGENRTEPEGHISRAKTPLPDAPGSAGLFSTVPDLLRFLHMLLNHGAGRGKRYFFEETIRSMHRNQIRGIGECTGLGSELNQQRYMGRHSSEHTFGKTGFTGCMCLCDMERQLGMVILSNSTYPRRKPDMEAINEVRRDLADIVFQKYARNTNRGR
jgi:CubicO group peptidase (beta-lactamase class C family)